MSSVVKRNLIFATQVRIYIKHLWFYNIINYLHPTSYYSVGSIQTLQNIENVEINDFRISQTHISYWINTHFVAEVIVIVVFSSI